MCVGGGGGGVAKVSNKYLGVLDIPDYYYFFFLGGGGGVNRG